MTLGADLAGLLVLAVVSFGMGGLVNRIRAQPLAWVYESRAQAMDRALARLDDGHPASTPDAVPDELPHEVRLDEFQSFVTEHKGLVLDARPAVFYHEAHVPGALSPAPRDVRGVLRCVARNA